MRPLYIRKYVDRKFYIMFYISFNYFWSVSAIYISKALVTVTGVIGIA
jgi:hypothetical protein